MATRTDTQSPALHVADSHDLMPHIGSPNAFSFNVPSVRAVGQISIEKGAGKTEKRVSGGAAQ